MTKNILLSLVFIFFLGKFLLPPVFAAEKDGDGINWVGGYISGTGYGTARPSGNKVVDKLQSIRAAEVMAQRALAETINGLRVDGETRMKDLMKEYIVSSRVSGVIRGAQKVRTEVTWEGGKPLALVELRICLVADAPECRSGNSLVNALYVEDRKEPSYVPAIHYQEDVPESDAPAGQTKEPPEPDTESYDTGRPVTGVVLRLGGMHYKREVYPVVVTYGEGEKYLTVYSAKYVKPEIIRTYGVVRHSDTVEQALKDPRLGDNAMVVTVAGVTRENMLVVRRKGARAIRETTRYGNDYLSEAKVVIAGR